MRRFRLAVIEKLVIAKLVIAKRLIVGDCADSGHCCDHKFAGFAAIRQTN